MTCSQCKDKCPKWEKCNGCRECRFIPVCYNAYKYLSDEERGYKKLEE